MVTAEVDSQRRVWLLQVRRAGDCAVHGSGKSRRLAAPELPAAPGLGRAQLSSALPKVPSCPTSLCAMMSGSVPLRNVPPLPQAPFTLTGIGQCDPSTAWWIPVR